MKRIADFFRLTTLAALLLSAVPALAQTAAPSAPAQTAPRPTPAPWFADLAAAQAQAKAARRPLLAVFSGSDWCKPCVQFEQEVFAQPAFAAYAQGRLVLAHFDYPRQPQNQPPAAQRALNKTAGAQLNPGGDFPLAVLVSAEGLVLARSGYVAGGPVAFAAYLRAVLGEGF